MIELRWPGQLLQPEVTTSTGRYPEIIAAVAAHLKDQACPQILSWGCSGGEELLALSKAMPNAHITGVDINPRCLGVARRKVRGDRRISLIESGDPDDLDGRLFDAVFCMAVMRHARLQQQEPESCAAIMPFAKVERFATALANRVRPGGFLAVWNLQFLLTDMAFSRRFGPVFCLERGVRANFPLYGRNDERLDAVSFTTAVFRKCPAESAGAPESGACLPHAVAP